MARFIEEMFGGDVRQFRLGIGQLRDLQDKCNAGPATIIARLMSYQPQAAYHKRPVAEHYALGASDPDYWSDQNIFALVRMWGGDWRIDDVREPIRLGLIGGGMSAVDAEGLMRKVFDQNDLNPISQWVGLAAKVLIHAVSPNEHDPVGKSQAETEVTPTKNI